MARKRQHGVRRARNNVVPYSRDYRRVTRFDMGLPKARRRRALDPRRYLRGAIVVSGGLLLALQIGPDAVGAAFSPVSAEGCRVVSVTDGDTVRMWCPERGVFRARLLGFDTPEMFSPKCASEYQAALKATYYLRKVLLGTNEMGISLGAHDKYGRVLADVVVDGVPLSTVMISNGYARAYAGGHRQGWCS